MRGWSGECLFVCSGNAKTQGQVKWTRSGQKRLGLRKLPATSKHSNPPLFYAIARHTEVTRDAPPEAVCPKVCKKSARC